MKNCKFIFYLSIALTLALTNCMKQKSKDGFTDINMPVFPLVKDGKFHFQNELDVASFYSWLAESCAQRDTSEYPFEEDWLVAFDCSWGVTSALTIEYLRSEGSIASREDSLIEEDWMLDDYRKALLNENYEISIGDYTYVYLSENQVYKVLSTDEESLVILRQTEKGDDYTTPMGLKSGSVTLFSDVKGFRVGAERGGGSGGGMYCSYTPKSEIYKVDCYPKQRRIYCTLDKVMTINGVVNSPILEYADWTVNWGDGTITTNSGFTVMLEHTYSDFGSYNIHISYTYLNCLGQIWTIDDDETLDHAVEVEDRSCSIANKHLVAHNEYNDTRMTSELWVKLDMFGRHQVATTNRYTWQHPLLGSPGWYRKRGYVKAEVNYLFRYTSNCDQGLMGLETDWGNWSYFKRAGMTCGDDMGGFEDGEIHSLHEIECLPNNLIHTLQLNACE